jgi:hypothetical protein
MCRVFSSHSSVELREPRALADRSPVQSRSLANKIFLNADLMGPSVEPDGAQYRGVVKPASGR